MSKWYEEAVFYHIYPLGLTGAPKYNTEDRSPLKGFGTLDCTYEGVRGDCPLYRPPV